MTEQTKPMSEKEILQWVLGKFKDCNSTIRDRVEVVFTQALRLAREPQWVSVEDRLPETGVAVFVDGGIAVWNGSEWESHMENPPRVIQWGVTHWMSLPNPPRI